MGLRAWVEGCNALIPESVAHTRAASSQTALWTRSPLADAMRCSDGAKIPCTHSSESSPERGEAWIQDNWW
jgi:hypothetical protein